MRPDPTEPIIIGVPTAYKPWTLAYFAIWDEVLKYPDLWQTFDAASILKILQERHGPFDPSYLIFDRLIEHIRLRCGLPCPHEKKEEEGSAYMWHCAPEPGDSVEYAGRFEIAADWSYFTLTLTPRRHSPPRPGDKPVD